MYRDDLEALRAHINALEAGIGAERRGREAAEAATRAAHARIEALHLALGRLHAAPLPHPWRRLLLPALLVAISAGIGLFWHPAPPPRAAPGPAPREALRAGPCVTHQEGYLVANTFPWARIFIDGRDTGKHTPLPLGQRLAVPPGSHRLTFEVDGQCFSQVVHVRPGQTTRILSRLPVRTASD